MFVVRSTDELNRDLERRSQRRRAQSSHHEQLRRVEREQLVVRERGRILADMHDGWGRACRAAAPDPVRRADQRELEAARGQALQEMPSRSMPSTVDGDIPRCSAICANAATHAGTRRLQVVWQVGDLAPIENLTPAGFRSAARLASKASPTSSSMPTRERDAVGASRPGQQAWCYA